MPVTWMLHVKGLLSVVLKINFDFFYLSRTPAGFLRNQWGVLCGFCHIFCLDRSPSEQ